MSKFKQQQERPKPKISTASLPDIIFMLLFFFMVVTVLRERKMLVKVEVPRATELQELKHRSLINHVYIGSPSDPSKGTAPVTQINDSFVRIDQLEAALKTLIEKKPDRLHPLVTTSLKVDKGVTMGIVSDVKTALRKANQLKVNYAAVAKRID